jgi:hypothetical protein
MKRQKRTLFIGVGLVIMSAFSSYLVTSRWYTQRLYAYEITIARLQTQLEQHIDTAYTTQSPDNLNTHLYPHVTYDPNWDGMTHPSLTLATELERLGILPETIAFLKFVGDEASGTSGVVIEDDPEVIEWIWHRIIAPAEPYAFWVSSGYRVMEIYLQGEVVPATTLYVNETESTFAEGVPGRFMCHGLEEVILSYLTKASP